MIAYGNIIDNVGWIGPHEIEVRFSSSNVGAFHQLYVGRRLAGRTGFAGDRVIRGQYRSGVTQPPLFVVSVDGANLSIDHGSKLPRRPWNLHRLSWTGAGMDADTDRFVVTAADNPDEAPSDANRLGAVPYVAGKAGYEFKTPARPCSGDWQFGVTPYDNTCGPDALHQGNAGTEAIATVRATVYPPDVAYQSDGHRFGVSVDGGNATVTFDYRS